MQIRLLYLYIKACIASYKLRVENTTPYGNAVHRQTKSVYRDFGVYSIKKKRITHELVEKLVRKYYRTEEKQRLMLEMIYRKLNNLPLLEEMFSSYSRLYLYEKDEVLGTEFNCDYLMVHESGKTILHLGLVKSEDNKGVYHCNSFMATYQDDRERDLFFCNLSKRYEINKIVRESVGKWSTVFVISFCKLLIFFKLRGVKIKPRSTLTATDSFVRFVEYR